MQYAIGDVQGCLSPLLTLLNKIQFNEHADIVWFTGDLVNRGPQSLETLRFIKSLGKAQRVVLGNHDLHLLALAHSARSGTVDDSLKDILMAPDREELIDWLLQQPLLYHDAKLAMTMIHAGLAPMWDLSLAQTLASEVSYVLQSEDRFHFFQHMYGNTPDLWQPDLQGYDRLRCITNYFTRVRYCYPNGRMMLDKTQTSTGELLPWFTLPERKSVQDQLIFGHWAALSGVTNTPRVHALDTGCVWGFALTAMCLETGKRVSVSCECQSL